MPLTISLSKGMTFKVGEMEVSVVKVRSASDFSVSANGVTYDINEDQWVTLAPGVEARAPYPRQNYPNRPRIQIEAPDFFITRSKS